MNQNNELKIEYCDQCAGEKTCSNCQGHRYFLNLKNVFVYWQKEYSYSEIAKGHIQKITRVITNILLFIILLSGLGSLVYHTYILYHNEADLLFWGNWKGIYILVFWISLIFDMFLFYRLRKINKTKKVLNLNSLKIERDRKDVINAYNSVDQNLQKILIKAWTLSNKNKLKTINPLYLFLAILQDDDCLLVMNRLGMNHQDFRKKVARIAKHQAEQGQVNSLEINKIMLSAYLLASKSAENYINISHVLRSLASNSDEIIELFLDENINVNQLQNAIQWIKLKNDLRNKYKQYHSRFHFKPKNNMNMAMTAVATPYLDKFSEDLTLLASKGYLGLQVPREDLLEEFYRVIETEQKSVLLIGQPGVGKDSILNNLASCMAAEDVPKILYDKRLVSLSLSELISASQDNQVEGNLIRVMTEVIRAGNIVLVISDLHNIVGVSSIGTENIDLSEVLAEIITKYDVMIIATTNPHDYKRYLEKNVLSNLLLNIDVSEPSFDQTVQILESKTFSIEHKYKIYFSYQAIEKIVKLTNQYIHDRFQPSKSIKILEEVAIMVEKNKGRNRLVTSQDVAKIVSKKVHIPIEDVSVLESEKLLNLEELIHQRIIGQYEAVKLVSSALRRARAELRDENKPISNLLFLGPTGVGKTELAKTVAKIYFGSEDNMIRLDMSEYQNKSSVARLIGVEGQSEGGVLTEAVRKNPFSLVLLDEIEKADPDILNIFLQVMDDGRLTDSMGTTIDFTNCIIIATSNAAAFYIQDKLKEGVDLKTIKRDLLQDKLRDNFKPEFLNRFNGVVLFKPLSLKEVEQIAVLMLAKVAKRLEAKNIHFEVSAGAVKELAKAGYSPQFGARPLARTIQQRVDNSLANFLLRGKIKRRDKVILEENGEIKIEKARKF